MPATKVDPGFWSRWWVSASITSPLAIGAAVVFGWSDGWTERTGVIVVISLVGGLLLVGFGIGLAGLRGLFRQVAIVSATFSSGAFVGMMAALASPQCGALRFRGGGAWVFLDRIY